jgi:hypothetical protein
MDRIPKPTIRKMVWGDEELSNRIRRLQLDSFRNTGFSF